MFALNGRRCDGAIVALSDEGRQDPVACRHLAHVIEHFTFRHGLAEKEWLLAANVFGDRFIDQCIDACRTDHLQHVGYFLG